MSYSVFTLKAEDDRPLGFATISQNIDARKQDDDRMELLIDELNHRVRNTLAIVNAIATQTMKHTPSVEEFRRAFGGRITALAKTHTLLATKRWSASTLHELIVQQLEPYTRGSRRCGAHRRTEASGQSEAGAHAQPGDARAGRQRRQIRRPFGAARAGSRSAGRSSPSAACG